jgi:hypothetical protein
VNPDDAIPPDFPPEFLAAYADGELDAETLAALGRWLALHPEARESLQEQVELGPTNAAFWERAEPPEPTEAAWANVRAGIERRLTPVAPAGPSHRGTAAWALATLATAGIAAALWLAFGSVQQNAPSVEQPPVVEIAKPAPAPEQAPAPRTVAPKPDLLAEFAVLPMASDDDVILDRVPDTRTGWLPVGRHPVPDALVLASVEEVDLQEVDPCPIWPAGGPQMVRNRGDAPMIFAAKPR